MSPTRAISVAIITVVLLIAFNLGGCRAISVAPAHWKGTKQFGTPKDDFGRSIAADAIGNIYVAGWTWGGLDGNTNNGGMDAFVVKYNPAGEKQWVREFGTAEWNSVYGVAADSSGNIYVVGTTSGGLDGNTNHGGMDAFVAKYSTAGEKLWTRQFGTASTDEATNVAVDSSGNIYVVGKTDDEIDDNSNAGGTDVFVIKYNSSGEKGWTRQFGTLRTDYPRSIATDSKENIYVVGETEGGLDGYNNVSGANDAFIVKYNSSGEKQWSRQFGSRESDFASGVATDSTGNIYVVGGTDGVLDTITSTWLGDSFVVKYNSIGEKQWIRQFGSALGSAPSDVATDSTGNIYVVGTTSGGLDGNINVGSKDAFAIKYDSAGKKQWVRQFGTASEDMASGIVAGANGDFYVVGMTWGGLDGNTNAGGSDIFIVKFNSAGQKQ